MSATHILTPGLLECWSDNDLIEFILDDSVAYGTPKPDLVLIAQEIAIRYDHLLGETDDSAGEEGADEPQFFDS